MIRKLLTLASIATLLTVPALAQEPLESGAIDAGDDDRTLVHIEEFDIPVAELWDYYTDEEQVSRWIAPVAQVDLRAGGAIRTNYDPCAAIGDEGTITLKIVAYVPERLLILQSDLEPQRDASWMTPTIFANRHRLYNLIEFEPREGGGSRIVSWGLGYGQSEEWATMIGFFEQGNAWTYGQLRKAIDGQVTGASCAQDAG